MVNDAHGMAACQLRADRKDVSFGMQEIEPGAGGGSVPALRRAVRILDLVAGSTARPSAAELARALGLPKSTAHGLLVAMVELGLLERGADGSYRLGVHPMRWTGGSVARTDLVPLFYDHLASRPALAAYTVTLSVREGAEVVYIGCRNSDRPLGVTFRIGMRLPAPFTATGKALLASLPDAEIAELLSGPWPARLTPRSVGGLAALGAEIAATRAAGYSLDDGQVREDMVCLGAALRDHSGQAAAGMAISLLRSDAAPGRLPELGAMLAEAARTISRRLGG
jgi:IclR family transcriptional regulator, blcABC operon repressor